MKYLVYHITIFLQMQTEFVQILQFSLKSFCLGTVVPVGFPKNPADWGLRDLNADQGSVASAAA